MPSTKNPNCGLYRTTRPLPSEGDVPAGILINVHEHEALVLHLPVVNEFNRWQWAKDPIEIASRDWLQSAERLPSEGVYLLSKDLDFEGGSWPARALVQLGYDRHANPIVFLGQQRYHRAENVVTFAEKGVPFARERLEELLPVVIYEEPDPNLAGGEATEVGGVGKALARTGRDVR